MEAEGQEQSHKRREKDGTQRQTQRGTETSQEHVGTENWGGEQSFFLMPTKQIFIKFIYSFYNSVSACPLLSVPLT